MNLAQLILRKTPSARNNLLCHNTLSKTIVCQESTKTKETSTTSSSSSSSESDVSDENIKKKTSSDDAVTRLNSLLQKMVMDDNLKKEISIKLAQPINKRIKGRKDEESVTTETVEKQVVNAVKDVAQSFGGNTKQTESELLLKLLNPVENQEGSNTSLSDILKGMKIERETKPQQSKAEQVRSVLQQVRSQSMTRTSVDRPVNQRRPKRPSISVTEEIQPQILNLFGSEPLGIFKNSSQLKESPQLLTWQKLYEKELKLAVTHPPENYFQQMILWTEQGKFWQFPINNEFGLEEESKVYFADHLFLEEHLEPWCPPKGPIRHFMELVCVGLSKNSYLTVEAKKEHIEWFKNYFEDKKKLLQEVGAVYEDQLKAESIDKE